MWTANVFALGQKCYKLSFPCEKKKVKKKSLLEMVSLDKRALLEVSVS